jgi:hypothetical protein
MAQCKLCHEEKLLIKKSHIIPDFMFRQSNMYNEKHQIYTFTLTDLVGNKSPKYILTGDYETDILCAKCDNEILGKLEEYGKAVLFGDEKGIYNPNCDGFVKEKNEEFWICNNVDYKKYKLFMLSILWRMSISSRPLFKNVNLKEHADKLREMILTSEPKEYYVYPFFTSSFLKDMSVPKDLIVEPIQYNTKGFININLIIPGMFHVFMLSTDPNAFPGEELKKSVINEENVLVIYQLKEGQALSYIKRYS